MITPKVREYARFKKQIYLENKYGFIPKDLQKPIPIKKSTFIKKIEKNIERIIRDW